MNTDERLKLLLTATADKLQLIDAILLGKHKPEQKDDNDQDVRTCTQADAAQRLGISISTVHRMVKSGKLKSIIVNKNPRVLISSIFAYAERAA